MRDQEIEMPPVRESQRQFSRARVKLGDVEMIDWGDAALHLEMRLDGLIGGFRELLVHGQVVVDPAYLGFSVQDFAVIDRLLNQSLHVPLCPGAPLHGAAPYSSIDIRTKE